MAELAKETQYVEDDFGIRRLVVAGRPVPAGLTGVETVEGDLRTAAAPVVSSELKPSGTAAEPNAGVSTQNAEALAQAQRDAADTSSKTPAKKAS